MELDPSETCLSCLGKQDMMINVFDTHICDEVEEIYAELLKQCFDIEITQESGLSAMCVKCVLKLRDAYYFKQEIIQTNAILMSSKDIRNHHLKIEYLNEMHVDVDLPKYGNYLNEYDIEPVLDPETGHISYIINSNVESEEIFPYHTENDETEQSKSVGNLKKRISESKKTIDNGCVKKNNVSFEISDRSVKKNDSNRNENKDDNCVTGVKGKNVDSDESKNFKNNGKVQSKQKRKYIPPKKPFTLDPGQTVCKICGEQFVVTKTLHEHMNIHYPNRICDVCGKKFASQRALRRHTRSHLDGPFYCNVCDKAFSKLNTRNAHIWRLHTHTDPYVCSECGDRFRTFHKRLKHLQDVHEMTERKYHCPYCDRKFFYAGSRSKHIRVSHLGERPHKCEHCAMAFAKKYVLRCHLANVHNIGEKKHKCTVCGKRYFYSTALKYHMRTHEKGGNKFTCDICNINFSHKTVLKCHLINHDADHVKKETEDTIGSLKEDYDDAVFLEYET